MKNHYGKRVVREYYHNETPFKKLYNLYMKKTLFEKIFNAVVLFAMIATIVGTVMSFLTDVDFKIILLVNSLSGFILIIFILELFRDYAKSKSKREFFKHHWIDIILVTLMSFFFFFMSVVYFLQFLFLEHIKPLVHELKEMRIFYKFFKKE